jgi:hypothetical protein
MDKKKTSICFGGLLKNYYMKKVSLKILLNLIWAISLFFSSCTSKDDGEYQADIIVYGGTSAAGIAIEDKITVQEVSYDKLSEYLKSRG